MSVRQLGPARRAARQAAAHRVDWEVERVARLLEEYVKERRVPYAVKRRYSFYEGPLHVSFYTEPGIVLLTVDGGLERGVETVATPEDARRAAAILVSAEREQGAVGKLLERVEREWGLAWKRMELEALRRYAPLLGRHYDVPELGQKTGDVYRDLLEALYTAVVSDTVGEKCKSDAVATVEPMRNNAGARVRVPVEPPLRPSGAGSLGGAVAAQLDVVRSGLVVLRLLNEEGKAVEKAAVVDYSLSTDSFYLSALGASLLMLLERERGLLTRLAEALEGRAGELERVLGDLAVAAEAAALLFG